MSRIKTPLASAAIALAGLGLAPAALAGGAQPAAPTHATATPATSTPATSTPDEPPKAPDGTRRTAALRCLQLRIAKDGKAVCTGDVKMWREDVVVRCNTAHATFDKRGRLLDMTCKGNVRMHTTDKQATAKQARYDDAAQKVTLSGTAKLKKRGMWLRGDTVVVDLAADTVDVNGGVEGLFDPEAADAKGSTPTKRKVQP